jgi:hypothetical protein
MIRSRTFARDPKSAAEKTQALKLVRTVIELALTAFPSTSTAGKGTTGVRIPLSDTIVRTLVSVAENADDAFRPIVLETLAEIGMSRAAIWSRRAPALIHVTRQPSSTSICYCARTHCACSCSPSRRVRTSSRHLSRSSCFTSPMRLLPVRRSGPVPTSKWPCRALQTFTARASRI